MEAGSSSDVPLTENGEQVEENVNDQNGGDPQEIAKQQTADELRCECPKGAVCVCPFIPASPLATCTTVFLLHHPNQEKYVSMMLTFIWLYVRSLL